MMCFEVLQVETERTSTQRRKEAEMMKIVAVAWRFWKDSIRVRSLGSNYPKLNDLSMTYNAKSGFVMHDDNMMTVTHEQADRPILRTAEHVRSELCIG
jgi:hypothetical protein